MDITKITAEAFLDPVFAENFLNVQDYLHVPTPVAIDASVAKWASAIDKLQYGTELDDTRLWSVELIWNDYKLAFVPVGFPDSTITPESEEKRQKYWGEYTHLQRSTVDTTKCMMRMGELRTVSFNDNNTYKFIEFKHLPNSTLLLYLAEFGNIYSTPKQHAAWEVINEPLPIQDLNI